jgi:hypothetical protein
MKVMVYTHDPMLHLVYLPEEAKNLFGEEVFDDCGVEIPEALAQEIHAAYDKLCDLSSRVEACKKLAAR